MKTKSLMILAVSATLAVAAFAASSNAQKSTVTVGDFAVKVTAAIGHPVTDRSAAVASLKTLGVKVDDMNASLTEGMAAKILADLGVRVSTTSPDSAVTAGKADQLAAIAGLASKTSSTSSATALPTFCTELRNRGQCDTCCTTALGCDVNPAPCAGGVCSKMCKVVLPPGQQSPSDPQP